MRLPNARFTYGHATVRDRARTTLSGGAISSRAAAARGMRIAQIAAG